MGATPTAASPPRSLTAAIATAWLVAGTLDGTAAVVTYCVRGGRNPERIAYYIASAALGRETASAGGAAMVLAGTLFHYLVALIWTVFFFLLYPRVALLRRNALAVGLVYGGFVWLVMNLIVVPLSRAQQPPLTPQSVAIGAAVLMLCIGLPISLLARRHYARPGD